MKIKNWAKFQHFKDRRPPWVKLYRDLLDDMEWHQLDPLSSKVLVTLWLLASEDENQEGKLPTAKTIAWRLRMSETEVLDCISKLSHWLEHDDIAAISIGYQSDAPETETETKKETERAPRKRSDTPRPQSEQTTLEAYIQNCKANNAKPVPDGHSVRVWANDVGITIEMLQIAWIEFRRRYTESEKGKGKKYKDWPGHFANAVKANWFGVWFIDDSGVKWSSKGLGFKAAEDARMNRLEVANG